MLNRNRLLSFFSLVVVLGIVLTACAPAATAPAAPTTAPAAAPTTAPAAAPTTAPAAAPTTAPAAAPTAAPTAGTAKGTELVVGIAAGSIDHLDPNLAYYATSWRIVWMACTPLLTLADAAGEAGKAIVPGLADLPQVSADGLTYTFKLHDGLKFANGTPITGDDVKATFIRIFSPKLASPVAGFFTSIVGTDAFASGKSTDISGITVSGNQIAFQLTQPQASFTNRLTMPLACIVPKGSPVDPQENGELLVTGPYMVKSYDPNHELILIKNPNYSGPVRAHFDQITIQIGVDPAQAGLLIRANQLDVFLDQLAAADASQIINDPTLKGRVFVNQDPTTVYIWMNNDVPPFDNVKVRQAVNYALDRQALLRVWGGPSQGQVTTQILPSAMESWKEVQNYPYTPDLAKAKQLLADAGVKLPIETTLRTINDVPGYMDLAQAIQAQLKVVGFNIKIESATNSVNGSIIQTRANKVPMALDSWTIDYADPDDVIDTLLNGERITDTNNQNRADFNVPEINKLIDGMNSVSTPDRGARWQAIDQKIMSEYAPWAPLLYPVHVDLISQRVKVPGWLYHPVRGEDLAVVEPATP
jgi:peptide/nickel transport system substrate-binding protein